ncbi:hypothetical protein [Microbacterium indicum]|uniref:hypothetical protein n=1 Tax=Microbacterium indicum TaxID=358100 RepID=UPI00048B23AB|nr:hypothetical protein [Microbacterium indicum]
MGFECVELLAHLRLGFSVSGEKIVDGAAHQLAHAVDHLRVVALPRDLGSDMRLDGLHADRGVLQSRRCLEVQMKYS